MVFCETAFITPEIWKADETLSVATFSWPLTVRFVTLPVVALMVPTFAVTMLPVAMFAVVILALTRLA